MPMNAIACDKQQSHASADNGMQSHATTPHHTEPHHTSPHQTTPTPVPAASAPLMDPTEAERISSSVDYCIEAARDVGFAVDSVAFVQAMTDLVGEFGEELVRKGLSACMENGVLKLAYLRKTLQNMAQGVPKPKAPIGTARGPRVLREQMYSNQR